MRAPFRGIKPNQPATRWTTQRPSRLGGQQPTRQPPAPAASELIPGAVVRHRRNCHPGSVVRSPRFAHAAIKSP
eukprot:9269141-Prorocentrum_lima.AAC.1